ncbi:MAG TPA: NAD-dependent epimerase/dehydratase family protein [Firmicutes bacterium]|nr:NAD-dependent epimerase/dehydratase family protein [Candidatus Fermentithermobacillaceae bacterium]
MGRVLVTGASGFIGSHIAHYLQAQGWAVRGMVRARTHGNTVQFPLVYGDLLDSDSLDRVARGVDTVIHCAGLAHRPSATLDEHIRINVHGTRSLLCQAIRHGVKQFIFMSSISVYGKHDEPYREEHVLRPVTPYGHAKARAEDVLQEMAASQRLPLVILRLSTVYGMGGPGNVNRLIRAVRTFGPIVIGDGKNEKSLTYVQNVAQLIDHAMTNHPGTSAICNVSDPRPYTLYEITETIAKTLQCQRRIVRIPKSAAVCGSQLISLAFRLVRKQSPISPQAIGILTESSVCDASRLKRELGFEARILLEEGLKCTIAR